VACGACGGRAGKWVSGEVAVHLGPPVLDKVERSWSCWRHPNASGVGVNVACAMGNTRFSQAQGDFLEGGCGRVCGRNLSRVGGGMVAVGQTGARHPWIWLFPATDTSTHYRLQYLLLLNSEDGIERRVLGGRRVALPHQIALQACHVGVASLLEVADDPVENMQVRLAHLA
jgi:hypothetical protein